MVLFSVFVLSIIVFSILIVPGVAGLAVNLFGIYLITKGNKYDSIKKLRSGLILIILGTLAFITFQFDVNLKLENANNEIIEEYEFKV